MIDIMFQSWDHDSMTEKESGYNQSDPNLPEKLLNVLHYIFQGRTGSLQGLGILGFTRGYSTWEIDSVAVDLRWSKMDEDGLHKMVLLVAGFDIFVEPKVLGIETNHMGWIYLLALVGGMGAMDLSLTHLRQCLF